MIAALGFPLGTRGQMFYLEPDLPNSLRPGARPRTTLSPSLALRDGEPWLAFGTPGGDQQDQWQLAFFTALVGAGDGANLQAVIDAPMFHTTHFPSSFYPREAHPGELVVEDRVPAEVLAELRERGHRLTLSGALDAGPAQRGGPGGRRAQGGGQPARRAGLRGRPLTGPAGRVAAEVTRGLAAVAIGVGTGWRTLRRCCRSR